MGGAAVLAAAAVLLLGSLPQLLAPASARTPAPGLAPPNLVEAWGFNEDGELGDGTTQGSDMPVEVSGLHGVKTISSGTHHGMALLAGGSVMSWGENAYGQLGNGTQANAYTPGPVRGLSEVAAVAAGDDHSVALLKNGSVMAWGRNSSGQLGDGRTGNSALPVSVSGLSEVVAISAGGSFNLALLKNGSVMAWGENLHGQLGDGTTTNSDLPVNVRGLSGVIAISAGLRHSLALLADGRVMAWGDNEYGQLGDGTEAQRDLPVAVSKLSDASAISAGKSQSLAVVVGSAVVAWGDNEKGQLGDGSHTGPELCGAPPVFACSKAPVAVTGLTDVAAISAGNHSLALSKHGMVMAWGPNNAGQLGDGSSTGPEACGPSASPCSTIPIPSSTRGVAMAISAGAEFTLALGSAPPGSLPQMGRCIKVAGGGAYAGGSARCTTASSTHNGHFEWLPGPGSNARFTERFNGPLLETTGHSQLSCSTAELQGEYTGAKTETITHFALAGCRDAAESASCQTNPLEQGVIEGALPLDGYLDFIGSGARPAVGWELGPRPPATSLVTFDCGSGSSAAMVALEGSVIGRATPTDAMVSLFTLRYKQRGGIQIPEFFARGERDTLILTTTPFMRIPAAEQVGLSAKGMVIGEEALEIKVKP